MSSFLEKQASPGFYNHSVFDTPPIISVDMILCSFSTVVTWPTMVGREAARVCSLFSFLESMARFSGLKRTCVSSPKLLKAIRSRWTISQQKSKQVFFFEWLEKRPGFWATFHVHDVMGGVFVVEFIIH